MKCPLCKGSGEHKDIDNPREKAEIARYLVSIGLPYGDIARVLGWKSKNSVTHALKDGSGNFVFLDTGKVEEALYTLADAIEWGHIDGIGKRIESILSVHNSPTTH